ncbi:MAG: hypothetical protein WCA57_08770 [Ilumatobacteraceae bacterium]
MTVASSVESHVDRMVRAEVRRDPTIRYGGDGGGSRRCSLRKRPGFVAGDHRFGRATYDGCIGAVDDDGVVPDDRARSHTLDAASAIDHHHNR